ncbi:hypothetical protein ACFX15_024055 [Malus domestica]
MPLRFLRKQSCWGYDSRDSESSVSSIFEEVIMLGVWLSRFGGRCLFDFGASNLVGSVVSNSTLPRSTEVDTQGLSNYPAVSDVVGVASFTCSTLAENFGKGLEKAGKVGASSISEIGPRGLWGAQLLRKRAPLRFLRSAFVAPLRFLKLRRVQIFIGAGIKFQSTLESPPVEASFLHF